MDRVNNCISSSRNIALLLLTTIVSITLVVFNEYQKLSQFKDFRIEIAYNLTLKEVKREVDSLAIELNEALVNTKNDEYIKHTETIMSFRKRHEYLFFNAEYYSRIGYVIVKRDEDIGSTKYMFNIEITDSLNGRGSGLNPSRYGPKIPDFIPWSITFRNDAIVARIADATGDPDIFISLISYIRKARNGINDVNLKNEEEFTFVELFSFIEDKIGQTNRFGLAGDTIMDVAEMNNNYDLIDDIRIVSDFIEQKIEVSENRLNEFFYSESAASISPESFHQKYKDIEKKYIESEISVPIIGITSTTITATNILIVIFTVFSIALREKTNKIAFHMNEIPSATWLAIDAEGMLGSILGWLWRAFIASSPILIYLIFIFYLYQRNSITSLPFSFLVLNLVFFTLFTAIAFFESLQCFRLTNKAREEFIALLAKRKGAGGI